MKKCAKSKDLKKLPIEIESFQIYFTVKVVLNDRACLRASGSSGIGYGAAARTAFSADALTAGSDALTETFVTLPLLSKITDTVAFSPALSGGFQLLSTLRLKAATALPATFLHRLCF